MNPLIYNTLQFDQYSRLAISLKLFRFSVNNSKTKSSYSFEDRGTDRQNRFRNVLSKTFQMIYDTPNKSEN